VGFRGSPYKPGPYGFASLVRLTPFTVNNGGFGQKITGLTSSEKVAAGLAGTFIGTPDQLTVPAAYNGRMVALVIRGGFVANPNADRQFFIRYNGAGSSFPWELGANPSGSPTQSVNIGHLLVHTGDTFEAMGFQNSGGGLDILNVALELKTIDWTP
jgi:hypothetical protein